MSNIQNRIQVLANILIIVTIASIGGVWAHRNFFDKPASSSQRELPKIGDKVQLADVDWSRSDKNVLLVLQKNCHFCAESADFYKQLIEQTKHQDVNIVAVLPQEKDESAKYLNDLGIVGLEIKQSQLDSLLIAGTPTVIVANAKGEITNVWLGKLRPEEESQVLAKLKS